MAKTKVALVFTVLLSNHNNNKWVGTYNQNMTDGTVDNNIVDYHSEHTEDNRGDVQETTVLDPQDK